MTPCTGAHQGILSMGFARQEYWSGLPFLLLGDLPDSGMEPLSPALAGGFFSAEPPVKSLILWSEVAQSCLTLCDPMDCSLPGSSIHGIFQARILEWVAVSFPGYLPNPGIVPRSPALQADASPSEPPGNPW